MSRGKIIYKIAEDQNEKIAARKFVHDKYLEAGYFTEPLPGGIYDDHHVDKSIYFIAVIEDEIVGVFRIIENSEKSLPVLQEFDIYPQYRKKLGRVGKHKVAEIGNLAANPRIGITIGLFKLALRYSLERGHVYWVAGIDKHVFEKIEKRYKLIRFRRIGSEKHYIGSICVPIMFRLHLYMFLFLQKKVI